MATRVFVDGQAGTTGLKIQAHLEQRQDLELLTIGDDKRKDTAERARLINEADIVFLCLPDDAAKESVSLVRSGNTNTRVLDASTALPHSSGVGVRHSRVVRVTSCGHCRVTPSSGARLSCQWV